MMKLKRKIKKINSLPYKKQNNIPLSKILYFLMYFTVGTIIVIVFYIQLIPLVNSVNISKIIGKRIYYTDCNTKDYIIIGKDKSYSLSITDNECDTKYYEGTLKIKSNTIIFNKKIVGKIDNNYNIYINDNLFKEEKDEN